MKSFEKLENRYELTGTLVLTQATHVGCGEGDEDRQLDAIFVQDKKGVRYIPGSSFRGALRSTVERLLASLDPQKSCLLLDGYHPQCPTSNATNRERFSKMVEQGKSEQELFNFLAEKLCLTCKVFGSPFMASKVRVADLYRLNNCNPPAQVRYGVGIDRDTETAASGLLFTYEVVEKGEKFHFKLWAENVTEEDLGVLGLGIMELLHGEFRVGAKMAAGLGQCQLREDSLALRYFADTKELQEYIKTGQFPQSLKDEKVKEFFRNKVEDLLGKDKKEADHAQALGE